MSNLATSQKKMSLEQWVHSALEDKDYERPCSAISVVCVTPGGDVEIKTTVIGNGRSWSAKDLADYLYNLAGGYCQDLPGVHTFKLLAFYGSPEPRLRHPFMVSGQFDNHGLGTEPATNEGQRMQHMRHVEGLTQAMMQERLVLLELPVRTIRAMSEYQASLMQELRETRTENLDAIRMAKEMILKEASQKTEREIALKKFERESKEREILMKFAPIVINELTGKEIVPQSTADTLLIETLAENLTEEGFQKIIATGAIPPEAIGILMSRMTQVLKKKREHAEAALARGSEADTDASDDPLLTQGEESDVH